ERSDQADVLLAAQGEHGPRHVWIDNGPRGPLPGDLATVHYESVQLGSMRVQRDGIPLDAAELAPDQLAAVVHSQGPARIIAPAGSGKTRVLTARLRHLIRDRHVEPELITAIAYNTRAAEEMRERLTDLSGFLGGRRPNVRTIHAMAYQICSWERRWDVLNERDIREILERLLRTPRIPNKDPFASYLEGLSQVRLGLVSPQDVEAERDDVDGFAEMFPRFREELERRSALDFDEQIYRAIELLLTDPEIRARAQRSCTHLLVDEFQDLTPAFLLLVRLLSSPRLDVFGVGDDDQVIYGHAGASPRYLIDFATWFPGAQDHPLQVNYRCPAPVVQAADHLLSHNLVRVAKTIEAGPDAARPEDPRAALRAELTAPEAQTAKVVELVNGWKDAGLQPGDIAVLARVNSALLPVQVAFALAGVPATHPVDANVLGRTGIRSALAWIRLAQDTERIKREDLMDTLRRPPRRVLGPVKELLPGGRLSMSILEGVWERLDGKAADRFGEYLDDLRLLSERIAEDADTARVLWIIRNRIGLGEVLEVLDASKGRADGSSHTDDLDALDQLAAMHPDPTTFRQWLVDALRLPGRDDGVLLSTIHKVKGREWPRVIVFAANAGLMPHRLAEGEVEEERRVFHVAITRCRDEVVIVANKDAPTPFLANLVTRRDPNAKAARVTPPPATRGQNLGQRDVTRDAPRGETRATTAAAGQGEADGPLFEALRDWRGELARSTGKPAYTIFANVTLMEIAEARPADLRALSGCRGVGPTKLEKYGDEVLEIVADHLD
ncbi:MAG: DNA helicase-2/ATP-dependent DNA helicase PcrA, partial [Glaciecola sp.]